jgi:flagellar protein FlaG
MPLEIASSMLLDAGMMQGSAARPAAIPAEAGGKPLPENGKGSPAPAREAPARVDLSRAVEALDRFMRETSRSLNFSVDDATGRTIITVMDAETGEIVRQIPPAELLNLARRMAESLSPPILLDTRA